MSMKTLVGLIIVALIVLVGSQALYRVHETERAILLEFGNLVEGDVRSGLHFKVPVAQDVKKFDARVLTLDSNPETYYTLEKKPLIVDSFVKWRVDDVAAFYESASFDERRANRLIQERVNEGLRNQISRRDMHEVISGERDQLMEELRADLDEVMRGMGVEVVDVRVKRIDLPPEVSSAVYDRMNSEREIEARQYRAKGRERALAIQAEADREAVVIEAEAYRESEQIRGDGDARSASIYASAYTQDAEFYEFYRSINAYTQVFQDKSDLLVLDPNSEFFKFLESDGGSD
ncbi:MAG: protease modulator HflC [Pseudomonadota bacterium]